MSRSNQKGFTALELLFTMLIVAVIGLIALFVYKHMQTGTHKNGQQYSQRLSTPSSGSQSPIIPVNHAYLGAFVNPEHLGLAESGGTPGANVIKQLPAFNQLVGKHLAIIHFYAPFKTPLPTSTLTSIDANGSIPLISWGCADVHAIADGQYDNTINSYANGIKSYGKPVFLRWYWEMNQMNKDGKTPAGNGCNGYSNGPGYVAAWQHIYKLFKAAKATNVTFVWCPGYSGGNFDTYYPGDGYVDWIGLDRYQRTQNGQPLLSFSDMFGSFYQQWSAHNKPLMIAETAAMGDSDQPQYLSEIQNQASSYPNIKAYVYFDATGPAGDWSLKGAGVSAFQSLAKSPYFNY